MIVTEGGVESHLLEWQLPGFFAAESRGDAVTRSVVTTTPTINTITERIFMICGWPVVADAMNSGSFEGQWWSPAKLLAGA